MWRARGLFLLHFFGNALMLWLAYYWLGVGESSMTRLAWSALVAVVLIGLAVWLHGAAFTHARSGDLRAALSAAVRNLLPLVALGVAVLAVYLLLAWWQNYSAQPAFKIASYLTLKLRKPVKPAAVLRGFNALLWFVRWVVVPVIVLPLAADVANNAWPGFRGGSMQLSRRKLYWLATPVLLLCAFWIPLKLVTWVPRVGGFGMEVGSFLVRFAIAYLLFVVAWLLLVFLSSGGSPRFSQLKTADSP